MDHCNCLSYRPEIYRTSVNTRPPRLLIMNYVHIRVRTTHCDIHLNVKNSNASFIYGNVPSRLNKIHERGVEILMPSRESSFVTLGSSFAGVRRLPLHPVVNYVYLMLCLHILGLAN